MDEYTLDEQPTADKSKSPKDKRFLIFSVLLLIILVGLLIFLSYIIGILIFDHRKNLNNRPYEKLPEQVNVKSDKIIHKELPVDKLDEKTEPVIQDRDNKKTKGDTLDPEKLNKDELFEPEKPRDLNTDDLNNKENELEPVVGPPKPPVANPEPNKVTDQEHKITEDRSDVVTLPTGEEEKLDVFKEDKTPKKVEPNPKPVEIPPKVEDKKTPQVHVESPKTNDVPENAEDLRKKYEEHVQEEKRKLKEEEDFKNELERLFKIRQEHAMEEARRIKELKERKKNPEGVKDSDMVVPGGSDKDTIFKKLEEFAQNVKHTVIKGSFEDCMIGKCEKLKANFVYQWELDLLAEVLFEEKTAIDLKKEYKVVDEYREFSKKYGKYMSTKQMFKTGFGNFRKNLVKIEKHNKDPNRLYNMEVNALADMGSDLSQLSSFPVEAKERLSGASKNTRNLRNQEIDVDWRKKHVVSKVVHQGSCGSCWAMAATEVFNSFAAIKKGDKTTYSYQQLVDCVSPKYNCEKGGSQMKALEYIKDNKMCKDEEYKYKGAKHQCSAYRCEYESGVKQIVSLKDKDALDFLKKNGPFLTLFYTSNDFFLYGDGIFNGSCEAKEAHSVVVVGHGLDTEKNKKYWIVKNSWGEDWGEQGFFRMLDESTDDSDQNSQYCDFLKYSRGIV
ncbi:uncharacterized protein TOT_020000083 [Theileria orientalis strain Shintoku]|uniref:Peptidase C1A papain C-terminal domain-containing protein n=1 Tax=Theileria orientalis strain Shintoku TaxID=869250 RepID=J4CCQ7_THEOR|nr:uncharacterized protein TOT_020000083 [Theileria orientalis strain Shintoku]BAM39812.1 uncharacterized protein TOT_020000083 [Theileria orientalis strain Shintoku]|eukprot:XP_009690113.1 uncharacterized protein TOT_020000083 [Theileria orientalis strain Shintoku]